MTEIAWGRFVQLVEYWAPHVLVALIILFGFWLAARISDRFFSKVFSRAGLNILVATLLARAAHIALIVFGVVTALGTLGINISALVAGLGLTGFAVGFALRDTISNLLAGVLLLIYRPFGINEHIEVAGLQGLVSAIDLRYTTLEMDGKRILIPNSKLFTDPITVHGRKLP